MGSEMCIRDRTCTLSDHDMGVQSALSPVSSCGLSGDEDVTIKVKNYGFLPQTDVQVSYQINLGPIVTETVPGTIDVGASVDFTFAAGANMAAIGTYNIVTWTELPLDTICLLYTSPSPRDRTRSRMPSSA